MCKESKGVLFVQKDSGTERKVVVRSLKHTIHIQYGILDNSVPCQQ